MAQVKISVADFRNDLAATCFVLAVPASPLKSKLRLQAENAVLRHQLIVVRRRLPGRVRLTNNDRWFLIQLYRWFPVSSHPEGSHNHPARDTRALAQGWFSLLLALEVAPAGRATADRHGAARIDPADERRKSALGRTITSTGPLRPSKEETRRIKAQHSAQTR